MFKNIVLATDGSEAADRCLPYAKALAAESDGATIVVVHAKELMVGRAAGYPVHPNEDELAAKIEQQVDELAAEGLGAASGSSLGPALTRHIRSPRLPARSGRT